MLTMVPWPCFAMIGTTASVSRRTANTFVSYTSLTALSGWSTRGPARQAARSAHACNAIAPVLSYLGSRSRRCSPGRRSCPPAQRRASRRRQRPRRCSRRAQAARPRRARSPRSSLRGATWRIRCSPCARTPRSCAISAVSRLRGAHERDAPTASSQCPS